MWEHIAGGQEPHLNTPSILPRSKIWKKFHRILLDDSREKTFQFNQIYTGFFDCCTIFPGIEQWLRFADNGKRRKKNEGNFWWLKNYKFTSSVVVPWMEWKKPEDENDWNNFLNDIGDRNSWYVKCEIWRRPSLQPGHVHPNAHQIRMHTLSHSHKENI